MCFLCLVVTDRLFIVGTLPPFETIYLTPRTSFALQPKSSTQPKYTLVLDLDETLVHCVMEPIEHYDIAFNVRVLYIFHNKN